MNCLIFDRDKLPQRLMSAALRSSGRVVKVKVSDQQDVLLKSLEQRNELVFTIATGKFNLENKLIKLFDNYSPDTILVRVSYDEWRKPSTINGVEVFTLATKDEDILLVQLDFLLRYALLKKKFRLSKQLLSLSEVRYQQLVDSANDPIAFVGNGMLLYANVEYLSLMGFKSIAEAASIPVRHLVGQDERTTFAPLCQQIEQRLAAPSRLNLQLEPLGHAPIRSEVVIQPASYRGKRCVQLRIKPYYDEVELPHRPNLMLKNGDNPWDKRPQQVAEDIIEKQDSNGKPQLQFSLHEALNLQQGQRPILFLAENWIQRPDGKFELYQALNPSKQVRLDLWNVRKVLIRLLSEQGQSADHKRKVLITLSEATLSSSNARKQLLNALNNSKEVNESIWFAISQSYLYKIPREEQMFLAQLYGLGIRFIVDEVVQESPKLFELIRRLKAEGVRLDASVGEQVGRLAHVSTDLLHLINWSESKNLAVVVDGVQDIVSMNRLSSTKASYLQGSILHSFRSI